MPPADAQQRDLRILVVLLRCRIQQAGARGLAEALALLETLCATYPNAVHHPQLLATEDITAEEACMWRVATPWRRCWTMKA
ncbi:type VI secretion system ImpA family N-terminal domain-containing protein [Actinoallomurus acanthiterrae]